PTLSPAGGTFVGTTTVTLATVTPGAQIRYTTTGSDPSEASALYNGALTLTSTTILKTRAYKSGMASSAVASATFVRLGFPPGGDIVRSPCVPSLPSGAVVRHALTVPHDPATIDMLTSVPVVAPFFSEDRTVNRVEYLWIDPTGVLAERGSVTRTPGAASVGAGLTTGRSPSKRPAGQWQVITCYW